METPLTGGCQCGKLRYELSEAPRLVYCCHCTSCQKITASAFSITVIVIEEAFHLTAGQPIFPERVADSGRVYTRWGLFRLRIMHYRSSKSGWGISRGKGRLTGRHIVAAANRAHLGAQQTAMGHVACRRSTVRNAAE
jgi:hypothetical protein